ncbi:MAG: formate dehydrogenase accessory sulfurtransferase FdhD [Hyphomicrobiales bacterium]
MAVSGTVEAWRETAGGRQRVALDVPEEVPLELRFNGTAYATMMVSPDDLHDFVLGFSLTEAIVDDSSAIKDLSVREAEGGLVAQVTLHGTEYAALLRREQQAGQRTVPGRSGCGICGVRTLDEARRALPLAPAGLALSFDVMGKALGALHQANTAKGAHAAAFCSTDGTIMVLREDVGRHNALDKLIGALMGLPEPPDPAEGFCLLTSRCSYEMVQKAVRAGFSTLVAMASPTGLALRVADEAGLTVIALARQDGMVQFTEARQGPQEIAV